MAGVGEVIQQLLGCSWGRKIVMGNDMALCPEKAVKIVILHDGPDEMEVRLCALHLAVVEGETVPHAWGPDHPDYDEMGQ